MNDLQIFNNPEFGDIRAIEVDGEAYFVGRDVATALGYAKPTNAVVRHVDEDDTLKRGITDSSGKSQQTLVINESGVYALIIMSQIPSAKKFKKWVTKEVLPSIRKTGSYNSQPQPMTTTEIVAYLANANVEFENRLTNIEQITTDFQNRLETSLQVFARPNPDHWKDDMEDLINQLIVTYTINPIVFRGQLYKDLENTGIRLESRISRLRTRMKTQGYVYKERMAVTKLDVISKDTQLRIVFESIVRKYQALYGTQASKQLAM